MKVIAVFLMILLAAATALAYGEMMVRSTMTAAAAQVVAGTSEPAALLLSGSLLLGLAGAVRRLTL